MYFDFSMNIGHIATLVSILVGGVIFAISLKSNIRFLYERIVGMEMELSKMADVLVQLGRQDERLTYMDRRIEDLKRGRGFIIEDEKN